MTNLQNILQQKREYMKLLELIKACPDLFKNIEIRHYESRVQTNNEKRYHVVKGLCAVNTHFHLSIDWQVECYIINKYGVTLFDKGGTKITEIQL